MLLDELGEGTDLGRCEVVPEEQPARVQGHTVGLRDPYGLLVGGDRGTQLWVDADGTQLLHMPVERVCPGDERAIVLEELPEPDQDLTEVHDPPDERKERFRALDLVDRGDRPVLELDDRSLDRVADPHRRGLARELELHLGADGHEMLQDDHGRRVDRARGEAGRAGPTVHQPEAARPIRVGEDRPTPDRFLQVLRRGRVVFLGGPVPQVREELPTLQAELVNDLPELRRLLAEPLGDHEAGSAPDPVRGDPREVAERADLRLPLGRLAGDRDGDVGDDLLDLLGRR